MNGSIEDRFEITEILHRHQIAIDQRDGDAYAALFAPDGRFESPFASAVGTTGIKQMTLVEGPRSSVH
ncbi:MAG: nuclear transport factor 2 family protein [Actinomycetota bacterium]|nr:nuclear transport factor 2 family protein [Actinomycetota bacterium]